MSTRIAACAGAVATLFRTLFFYVFAVFWTGLMAWVLAMPVAILERLFRVEKARLSHTILHRFVYYCGVPWRWFATVEIDDAARVGEGEAVVVCNHHSFIDIFLLFHIFPRIRMTARRSLFWIPFLGWSMHLLQHIPHHRENPDEALDKAAWWLDNGFFVGIFPEGTRAPTGQVGPFRRGAFRLAGRTTGRVQPVVVVGTGRVWAKRRFFIRALGPVAMKVLPPVEVPSGATRRELIEIGEQVRDLIVAEHRALEARLFPSQHESAAAELRETTEEDPEPQRRGDRKEG